MLLLSSCAPQPSATLSNPSQPNTTPSNTTPSNTTPSSATQPSPAPVPAQPANTAAVAPSTPGSNAARSESGPNRPTLPSPRLITVTIYKADDQCVNFVPQRVQVPENDPMSGAIAKLLGLESHDSGEFDLSGYRVTVNPETGEATVDLRMNPNSKRQIVSLSACEQFALFGSLRETLTKNPQWKIESVRFTERGKEIVL